MVTKNTEEFRKWLISTHKLQHRSAGDVISRRKKLLSIVPDSANMSIDLLKARLEQETARGKFPRTTLSAMIRAESLFRKFLNT